MWVLFMLASIIVFSGAWPGVYNSVLLYPFIWLLHCRSVLYSMTSLLLCHDTGSVRVMLKLHPYEVVEVNAGSFTKFEVTIYELALHLHGFIRDLRGGD